MLSLKHQSRLVYRQNTGLRTSIGQTGYITLYHYRNTSCTGLSVYLKHNFQLSSPLVDKWLTFQVISLDFHPFFLMPSWVLLISLIELESSPVSAFLFCLDTSLLHGLYR